MLPSAFLSRMQSLLGTEYDAFLASYQQPRTHGLRVNSLKVGAATLRELMEFSLEPVPWATHGYYFREDDRPGIHPFHAAGLYYIQEPSAMAAAQALAPRPGERVLDLCAAPGGKTTHLATLMENEGLLVANEFHPQRAQILAENLERFGVTCAAVLQEDPDRLAGRFPAFFDRILVDAPCSGEGMFRKAPEAAEEWAPEAPAASARRQEKILSAAVTMLRPGGSLLYSTCTFAPEENEQVLLYLLQQFPDLKLVDLSPIPGAVSACAEWAGGPVHGEIARAVRLWPHRLRGEGHFLALLHREGAWVERRLPEQRSERPASRSQKIDPIIEATRLLNEFCTRYLNSEISGLFQLFGEELYRISPLLPDLGGLRVVQPGWHLGSARKGRFEPAHALAMAFHAPAARQSMDLDPDSDEVLAFLRGETLPAPMHEGWTLVTIGGYPLGWGKASGGVLKNHYPKSLRWTLSRDRDGTLRTKPGKYAG